MTTNNATAKGSQSMLWGIDLATWELWGVRLMFAGAFVGVVDGLPNEVVQLEPNADGLMLRVRNKQNAPQAIVQFQRLVHSLGINIPVAEDASLRDHAAVLTILRKPD